MDQSETSSPSTGPELPFDPAKPETLAQRLLVSEMVEKYKIEQMLVAYPDLPYADDLRHRVPRIEHRIAIWLDYINKGEPADEWPLRRHPVAIDPVGSETAPEQ